ncbi:MAG: D-glycerate dehydrogenase [Melioribacter sp.]|uniref:2-hydroxyacid dehydrogenase n=1 Tax=Rosettibacter primus TaxID=3111523 RepID=UPI00247DA973|nr:D-glycerate dehydrogenase [Melioribacter sp.]
MKKKIFITQKLVGNIESFLEKHGFIVETFEKDRIITKNELIKRASDTDALICLLSNKIDREVIDNLKKCKIIANYAVGYNNIDVEYAKSKNIVVTNTPEVLTDATADIAVALILACARRFHEGNKMMRQGKFKGWKPSLLLGYDIKDKTIGIIGAGRIGSEAAIRMKAFKTKIIYYSRSRNYKLEKKTNAKRVSLNYLLKNADIISIHVPLTEKTYHMLNKENLSLLKESAIVVNTSRGEVVEEKFLIELLKKNKIFAAGFDVYENEPNVNPELLKLNNVFLLPHIGSATFETRTKMALLAAQNVAEVLKGNKPLTPV